MSIWKLASETTAVWKTEERRCFSLRHHVSSIIFKNENYEEFDEAVFQKFPFPESSWTVEIHVKRNTISLEIFNSFASLLSSPVW